MNGRHRGRGGGVQVGILGGVCRPVLQIQTVFDTKKKNFFTPVSDLASKEIMSSIVRLEQQQKRFRKMHYEFAFFSFFLIHLIWKRYIRSYTVSLFPSKTI